MSTLTKAQLEYKLGEANDIISNQKGFLREKETEIEELKSKIKLLENQGEFDDGDKDFDAPEPISLSDLEDHIESFAMIAKFMFGKEDCKRDVRRLFKILKEYIETPKEERNRFITLTLMKV